MTKLESGINVDIGYAETPEKAILAALQNIAQYSLSREEWSPVDWLRYPLRSDLKFIELVASHRDLNQRVAAIENQLD